jgi:hypothetical protein
MTPIYLKKKCFLFVSCIVVDESAIPKMFFGAHRKKRYERVNFYALAQ